MLCKFPQIIASLRKAKGISQKQAADEMGISPALLSHYEKGIRECGLDFLLKLATYYGVSCDYLLGKTEFLNPSVYDIESEALAVDEVLKIAKKHNPDLHELAKKTVDLNVYRLLRTVCDNASRSDTFTFDLEGQNHQLLSSAAANFLFASAHMLQKERKRIPQGEYVHCQRAISLSEKEIKKRIK